jgi:TPR repeat protein
MVRARDRVRQGDIAGARRLLERAASSESSDALLALAETYDAATLARWGVIGTRPDNAMARSLYERAASRGASAARERLLALVQ